MHDVVIVGGGPAGLSGALFTEKNGLDTVVFDTDETWMHKAHLFNYLGIDSMDGSEFVAQSREQVEEFGVTLRDEAVTAVEETAEGFAVTTEAESEAGEAGDQTVEGRFLVLATGADRSLADSLGCAFTDEDTVDVTVSMETSVDDAYATGAMVRAEEWQAVISAGDGAAAALNILSKEKGEHFHDFDVPADAE
ncbi:MULTISPECIES: NAD(P)/FAD-dependent oxidoreductase [Halomicrobium]|uniref:FAD-dependent pyridine nucleotide-disulphide oxidoreductase n=2 Tax=Halomicrobium mukohataei TaxID=57705 RepID=C7P1X6_HALMD|nr:MULTISPECIES: FAD-dependent oxidoreductase [Halomicrobium]ACV49216.1 FAD-dependent pyridine nucleotide-disulphide oxidoreductase [Halomicrobium mukohataei DSM 12286]QCD64621.1 NAD(P)/FAD-dependent oxidoreductase [Halomicrobium mukohataei]QFR19428.1 FAD-binding protein [Halomicrobium sp. ZPS1]